MNTANALDFWEVVADDKIDNLFADLLWDSEKDYETQNCEGFQAGQSASIERGHQRLAVQLYEDYSSDDLMFFKHMFSC